MQQRRGLKTSHRLANVGDPGRTVLMPDSLAEAQKEQMRAAFRKAGGTLLSEADCVEIQADVEARMKAGTWAQPAARAPIPESRISPSQTPLSA